MMLSGNVGIYANTFYRLLLNATDYTRKPGDNYRGNQNTQTQTHLFYDLNALTNYRAHTLGNFKYLYDNNSGELQKSQKNIASKFKNGNVEIKRTSTMYLLNNYEIVNGFDRQVRTAYSRALSRATTFVNRHLWRSECEKELISNEVLVQQILYLLLNDDSICDSQKFYICSDGTPKSKLELKSIGSVSLAAFLLGVWHYLIVSQRLQMKLDNVLTVDPQYEKIKVEIVYASELMDSDLAFKKIVKLNHSSEKIKNLDNEWKSICDFQENYYPFEMDRDHDIISVLNNDNIVLSRSIFFYLLTGAIQTIHPKQNKNAIEKLFLDLLNLTVGECRSMDFSQSCARNFRDRFMYLKKFCSADCLDDAVRINEFSDRICENYDEILCCMIKIREKYFNSNEKNERLVINLIEFIRNDNSIPDNEKFVICSDGSTLTKAQLTDVEKLEFEPFLLDVWYYVVTLLSAKDAAGEHTFDAVFKMSYSYNGNDYIRYRLGDPIAEQSDLYVELIYLG
jgi:hypothetical protein